MAGKRKILLSITMICFFFLSVSGTVFAQSEQTGTVSVEILNLRQTPTQSSKILIQLTKGMQVGIGEKRDNWVKVNVKGLTGWVLGQYLSPGTKKIQKGTINSAIVNLRSAAGLTASIQGKLVKGETVTILQAKGIWLEVKRENGSSGWVRKDFVKVDKASATKGMNVAAAKDTPAEYTTVKVIDAKGIVKELEIKATALVYAVNYTNFAENTQAFPDLANPNSKEQAGTGTVKSASAGAIGSSSASTGAIGLNPENSVIQTNAGTNSENYNNANTTSAGSLNVSPIIADATSTGSITISVTGPDLAIANPAGTNATGSGLTSASSISVILPTINQPAEDLISFAKSLLGVPYVYGGMSQEGFDCSGFTGYVYSKFGIKLERTSTDQAKQGNEVMKENLKPGNLVFFDTNGGHNIINHVGIYMGEGKFIHASSGSSHSVIISDITTGYYASNYMTARGICAFGTSNSQ